MLFFLQENYVTDVQIGSKGTRAHKHAARPRKQACHTRKHVSTQVGQASEHANTRATLKHAKHTIQQTPTVCRYNLEIGCEGYTLISIVILVIIKLWPDNIIVTKPSSRWGSQNFKEDFLKHTVGCLLLVFEEKRFKMCRVSYCVLRFG